MRISAINVTRAYQMKPNQNFKGLFSLQSEDENSWDYTGIPSGSSGDGHYKGSDTSKTYKYYPFAQESEKQIQKVLEDNNYTYNYNPDSTGGYAGSDSCTTTRGKTLPFTEKEWNRMSQKEKDRIRALLD